MVAEGVGFEPTVRSRVQRFSRPPRSTTPAPLREVIRLSRTARRVRPGPAGAKLPQGPEARKQPRGGHRPCTDRAFLDHLVLFFRDQELTPAQQAAFAGRFGPIGRYPLAEPLPEHPDVIAIVKEPGQTTTSLVACGW